MYTLVLFHVLFLPPHVRSNCDAPNMSVRLRCSGCRYIGVIGTISPTPASNPPSYRRDRAPYMLSTLGTPFSDSRSLLWELFVFVVADAVGSHRLGEIVHIWCCW